METPRSGLIRATEKVIKEYIKDSCERHLPLISKLEEISYDMWVESNTDFLHHSLLTEDDDDDEFVWDDAFMPSFTSHIESPEKNDSFDELDVSSIGSSIKPCDESDCSIGYLAGSEDDDDDDADKRLTHHVTCETNLSIESKNNEINEKLEQDESYMIMSKNRCKRRKCYKDKPDQNGCKVTKDNPQDWLIVDSDLSQHVHSLSISDTSSCHKVKSKRNVNRDHPKMDLTNDCVISNSEGLSVDSNDTEEWSVLSMEVKEHIYKRTRRRLFKETGVSSNKSVELDSNVDDVLSYLDTAFSNSNAWLVIRLLIQIIGFLLHKYR